MKIYLQQKAYSLDLKNNCTLIVKPTITSNSSSLTITVIPKGLEKRVVSSREATEDISYSFHLQNLYFLFHGNGEYNY